MSNVAQRGSSKARHYGRRDAHGPQNFWGLHLIMFQKLICQRTSNASRLFAFSYFQYLSTTGLLLIYIWLSSAFDIDWAWLIFIYGVRALRISCCE